MKPKIFTAVLLFISAYSPLFVILAVKDFDFENKFAFNHPLVVTIILFLTTATIGLLFFTVAKMERGNMPVTVRSVKNRSADLINYTIPYILSFFGFDLSKWGDIISLTIFLFIMMLLTIKSKSVFLNPILALKGYGLYDLDYTFNDRDYSVIVLCKEELRPGDTCFVRSLTRFLYFVTDKKDMNNDE
jgi:hypothetical protein